MFHIIYSGHRLPTCDNEFGVSRDNLKHAQTHSLLGQLDRAEEKGYAVVNLEGKTLRHIIYIPEYGMTDEQKENLLEKLDITIVVHAHEYQRLQIVKDVYVTRQGNIGCSKLSYFSWPTGDAWKQALTTGWKTRSFTMYAEVKERL